MSARNFMIIVALFLCSMMASSALAQQGELVTLTVAAAGNGTGYVVSNPSGIACGSIGSQCSAAFKIGTPITLTTRAMSAGSFFAGWSFSQGSTTSGCQGGLKECSFILTQNSVVQANFGVAEHVPYSSFLTVRQ